MAILAPLFLLGALTIGLPIWLHRLQTKSSEREQFSSTMLLEASERQIHVKKELRYLLLLALRIGLLLLIALAFAKPILERLSPLSGTGSTGSQLLLIDLSMSMSDPRILNQSRTIARSIVDASPAGAPLVILAADDTVSIAGGIEDTTGRQRQTVSAMTASALRLDFGQAMAGVSLIAENLPAPVSLHVVSDFQVSGMPARFADLVPEKVDSVRLYPVDRPDAGNWSIDFARQTKDGIEVGVRADGTAGDATLRLELNGEHTQTRTIAAENSQTVLFSGLQYIDGDNRISLTLDGDDRLVADDRWHLVVENTPRSPVPLITADSTGLSVTYLTAALESDGSTFRIEAMPSGELDPRVLSRYPWLIIDDIGALDGRLEEALRDYLQQGGNVLAFSSTRAFGLEVLPLSDHSLRAASLAGNEFLSIGQIDTSHPLLTGSSGWHKVRVSRSLPLEPQPDDQILVRLENGEPFLVEQSIGGGRLLLFANGADNQWSDLPLHPVFVAFVADAADYLSGSGRLAKNFTAGDRLPLSLIGSASGQVVDPEGVTVLSLADTTRAQLIRLDKTGIYEVYTPQGEARVAVNVDPRESRLEPMSPEVLERWQQSVSGRAPLPEQPAEGSAATRTVELWHWLLLLLAIVVIGESLLGNAYMKTRTMA